MMLSLDTAYRSFGGEVEALSTPTICRLPDSRRHQLSAIAHVAIGRDVVKQLAVLLPVRLLQGEKAAQIDRRFAGRRWIPSHGLAVAYHIAFGVFVVFVEGDADRHVQQMPDRAAGIN